MVQTSFAEIPDELWDRVQVWIPTRSRGAKGGRPRIADRRAMSGILYRLRTGCQWDAIPSEFGSRSTCYRRFREWTAAGVFKMMYVEMLLYYDEQRGIDWAWAFTAEDLRQFAAATAVVNIAGEPTRLYRNRGPPGHLDSATVKAPKGGDSPGPIRLIVESLERNVTSSPTDAASRSQSR